MGMRAKAHAWHHEVVVDDAQAAVTHPARVVIIGETERVIGVEPAVISVASFVCFSNCRCFHDLTLRLRWSCAKYHVSCLSITKRHKFRASMELRHLRYFVAVAEAENVS